MRDVFSGRTVADLEMAIDIFVKSYSKCLVYFKRDPIPTFKNCMYYLDVEYEFRDHQVFTKLS